MKSPKAIIRQNALLASMRSLSSITKSDGTALETHVILANGWITANNGILGIGEKIDTDLFCAPNAKLFESALSRCNGSISITQHETKLAISSGPFRAQVPFIPIENLTKAIPDDICGLLDNSLRVAFESLAQVPEREESPLAASVLISEGSAFSTDRTVILEAYHGLNMPTLSLPKSFVKIVKGIKKNYKGFGFSKNSFTLWLEDDSWIKTQLWAIEWPDIRKVLNTNDNLATIPKGLWDALEAVKDFSIDGWAYSRDGNLCSHDDNNAGSSYRLAELPDGVIVSIEQLLAVKPWAKKIDFFAKNSSDADIIKIVGDRNRAVIAGRRN